jgi:cell division protein FtsL
MSNCRQCGAPLAPSWAYCPKCASPLADGPAASPPPEPEADSSTGSVASDAPRRKRASRSRRRLTGVALALLVVGCVAAFVAVTDVYAHNQLRLTRSELADANRQLNASRSQVNGLTAQVNGSQSLVAQALTQIGFLRSFFLETQSEISLPLPEVLGTGGILLVSPLPGTGSGPTRAVLTAFLDGALKGDTYAIAAGGCPENLSPQSYIATSTQTFDGGTLVLPTVSIKLPANGARFWFRLHMVTPGETSPGVLGGVLGPFTGGSGGRLGTPVPPNEPAC